MCGSLFPRSRAPHAQNVNAIHRDLVTLHEIADDRIGKLLRSSNRRVTPARGKAPNLKNVAVLIFEGRGHFVERVLSLLAESCLTGAEANLGLRAAFVLVEIADHALGAGNTLRCRLRSALGRLRPRGRVGCVLIRKTSFFRRQLNALPRTRVDVLDLPGILGGDLVELINAIADRSQLALDPCLAGKWVRDQIHDVGIIAVPEISRLFINQRFADRISCGRGG